MHFIGNLQSRNIARIVSHCSTVHSLCNEKHAKKMNKIGGGIRLPLTQLQEKNYASIETEMLKLNLL